MANARVVRVYAAFSDNSLLSVLEQGGDNSLAMRHHRRRAINRWIAECRSVGATQFRVEFAHTANSLRSLDSGRFTL